MYNAGDLVASIRVDGMEAFDRDVDRAGAKWKALGGAAQATLQTAATGTTTAGAVLTAYVAKLFATGVSYNQLQQTSRAALKTMLGGAEAANAQMDKLDAFARTSPFSKQVFISAQQQMLGFGIETKKVIPYLDAVQNAVAAVGGSNQDIAGLVEVMSKIRSSMKITSEDLAMFGNRGVDAATLIGSQMGKTGQQIREEITAGTLDANAALDALAAGMQEKFGGAAANVKQTLSGAIDRIKAAQREIGAALAEPFVSQNGGGLFVLWGNQVADVMQAVRGHTKPVVDLLAERAAPAFAEITRTLDKARVVIKAWDPSNLRTTLNTVSEFAPVLAGATTAWVTFGLGGLPVIGRFVGAINPLVAGLAAMAATSPEVRAAGRDLLAAFEPLVPVGSELANIVATALNSALPVAAVALEAVAHAAEPVVDVIAAIPGPVLAAVAAGVAFHRMLGGPLAAGLKAAQVGLQQLAERMAVQAALGAMEGNTSRLAGAFGVAGGAATGLGNSMRAAFVANPAGLALLAITGAVALLTAGLSSGAEKASEHRRMVDELRDSYLEAGAAIDEATEAFVKRTLNEKEASKQAEVLGLSMKTVTDAALGNSKAMSEVEAAVDRYNKKLAEGSGDWGAYERMLNGTYDAGKNLTDILDQVTQAQSDARVEAQQWREEQRRAAAAMDETQRSNARMNEALAIARDVSKDATERLNGLKQALDELNGGTRTQADLTQDLNDRARSLVEAFAAVDENGVKLAAGLVSASGEIDTTTAAGSALKDQIDGLNDEMMNAIIAADAAAEAEGRHALSMDEAQAAAQPYIDKLRQVASDAGLGTDQVDALIESMLATPSVVAFALTDDGTVDAAKLRVLDLATQIQATPDKEFEVSSDDFPGLKEALRLLGVDINSIPVGNVKVRRDDGSYWSVEETLNYLARTRTATIRVDKGGNPGWLYGDNSANGNLFQGAVRHFANGGMASGLYAGIVGGIRNGNHVFAERELGVPWELYLSGKATARARNQALLERAAPMLGMQVVPLGEQRDVASPAAVSATTFAAGAAPLERPGDLDALIAAVVDAIKGMRPINVHPSAGMSEEAFAEKVAAAIARGL